MLFSFLLLSFAFTEAYKDAHEAVEVGLAEKSHRAPKKLLSDEETQVGALFGGAEHVIYGDALTPPAGSSQYWIGTNKNWEDMWGWCIMEDKRRNLPKKNSRADCLIACDQQVWNGEWPTGCEYSASYRSCAAFWGGSVKSSQRGSNYRCNIGKEKKKNFKDHMGGFLGTYKNMCSFQDSARGCVGSNVGAGPRAYTQCTCSGTQAETFECNPGYTAEGVGTATQTSFEGCMDRFKATGKKFVYDGSSQQCQETKMVNTRSKGASKVCRPLKDYARYFEKKPAVQTTKCVDGIVEVSPRPKAGKYDRSECEQRARQKGGSFVWSFNNDCHLYNVMLNVDNYSPTNGKAFWETCTPLGADSTQAITMHRPESGSSTTEVLVNAFAAIGLAATLFGAFRFYTSK